MPTLSPFGLLLIFLALSVVPPSATRVRIDTSPAGSTSFTREGGEWWAKRDETGQTASFKHQGTNLLLRAPPGRGEIRTDMAVYFDLTGREDLTRDATIRAR